MLKDLVNEVVSAAGIVPAAYTGTSYGTPVDFSNAKISTNAVVEGGAYSGTSATVKLQECATTNGTFTDISGMSVAITASNSHTVLRGLRQYRYVRAALSTANVTSMGLSVTIIGQKQFSGSGGGYDKSPST